MFIPLSDQIEEQAQRKVREREEKKIIEANKDQAFFKAPGTDGLFDIDAQKKKNERMQAILKQTIAQEKGVNESEIEFVKPDHEGKDDPYLDTVDMLPLKNKKKWRLWISWPRMTDHYAVTCCRPCQRLLLCSGFLPAIAL